MKASDKIVKAKVKLVFDQPFFATIALKMLYHEDATIQTACTDGKRIKYNPKFIDGLTLDQTAGLLAHEVMHCACLHHTRRQNRDPRKFNIACDYAINPMIIESKMVLPKGALIDQKFAGMSAEEIYSLLPDEPGDNNQDGQGSSGNGIGSEDPGNCGAVEDSQALTQSEVDQIEAEMKQTLAEAALVAKQQGNMPGHLQRLVDELLEPHVPWKEVLSRFLNQISHADYTWTKPNKRYIHAGLFLPSLENKETGEFVLMVDTSGSIGGVELNQFAAEIQDIANSFNTGFKVLYVDTEVAGVQDIEPDEVVRLEPKGGGGTDFVPGFEWIDKEGIEPSAVVYLTDGCCNSFPKDPGYPVLWALHSNKTFTAPFGEYVHL